MAIIEQYIAVRRQTEEICTPLHTEDYVPQPAVFVSPPKWHMAHSTWFFEQFILKQFMPDYQEFSPDFGFLFNSYYNNVGKRVLRHNRGAITRPGVTKVYEYRRYVDQHMELLLKMKNEPEILRLAELGINHEQQHQELLITDIKYILGCSPINPIYSEDITWEMQVNDTTGFVIVEEGIYEIGNEGNGYSFDNEHGRHKVHLNRFEISNSLVTNSEYIQFIASGGYSDFNYWLDEGWAWVNENNIEAPLYWHKDGDKWMYFTLSGYEEVNPDAIVTHISFYEAAAYAEWKKMRLPTEAEWETASAQLNWGKRWEWTNSAYLPYPGFEKPEGAVGEYNGKFMINQMVLRGASCATAQGHSRATYRNFFHPDERWQFTGIRLVKR